jgi:predicted Ser/Thr protein kinase
MRSSRVCATGGAPRAGHRRQHELRGDKSRAVDSPMIAPDTIVGGRYKVVKPLGGGGMKLVYLAEDLRLASRRCALAEMIDSLTKPEMQRQAEAAFQREADMLAQLSNEHIPRIFDCFSERNHHYLVMEYIEGLTLDEELKRAGGRLPQERAIEVALQVLETLIYLHGLSPPVIYRDLKPSNVMLASNGQAKLIDFGIARHFQPLSNATMIGTQGYAPPEQYRGKVELRSDLYALAATMHHCLSGRDPSLEAPFSFPALGTVAPQVSPTLASLIDNALEYDIDKRVSTAQEFRRRLIEIKDGIGNPRAAARAAPPPPTGSKAARPQLKLPLGAPAGGPNASRSTPAAAQSAPPEAATVLIDSGELPCPGCGRRIPADSRFCSYCAADLRHVLGPAQVAGDPEAKTAPLPDLRTVVTHREALPGANHGSLIRQGIPILIAIFAFAFIATLLIWYFVTPSTTSLEPAPPPFGMEPGPPVGTMTEREAAIRRALDFQGYTDVHFKIQGDTIVLWGSVRTQADRMMVQTIVFTVGNIFSLDDHLKVTDGAW